jgi:hypothetical protein
MSDDVASNRLSISQRTWKRLFAESGNICAFPGCRTALMNLDGEHDVQIAHIRAVGSTGARFDPSVDPQQLRAFENLLLLCNKHHDLVDQAPVTTYTPEAMEVMKRKHAARVTQALAGLLAQVKDVTLDNDTVPPVSFARMVSVFGRPPVEDQERADWLALLTSLQQAPFMVRQTLLVALNRASGADVEHVFASLTDLVMITETPMETLRSYVGLMNKLNLAGEDTWETDIGRDLMLITTGPGLARVKYLWEFALEAGVSLDTLILDLDWSSMDS